MSRFRKGATMDRALRRTLFCILFLAFFSAGNTLPARAQVRTPAGKALTVERIYSNPPLAGGLTQGIAWCPDSKCFSYLGPQGRGESAEPALWVMDTVTGERRVLVNAETLKSVMPAQKAKARQATGLGRVTVENYFWSPDGHSLLFTGGGNLVRLDLGTMASLVLVSGEEEAEDPKFSPDGKWVSFVRNSNLWVVNVSSGEIRPLTTGGSEEILKGKLDWLYPEELDTLTAYWWSPDSSKIAYFEMDERKVTHYPILDMSSPLGATEYTRFPQAGEPNPIVHVGVVPIRGGETKWMDTGADTDLYLPRVNWLRDSRRIAIQRLNRAQNRLDLLFCDASTGASRTILTETDKYWINLSDDLYFFSDGRRFLWSSERTGFRHFYIYDLSGKELQQVTSGAWQVSGVSGFGPGTESHPAVDETHGDVYFLSNKDDARESQLYRVSLRDKSLTRITREPGTHVASIAPDSSAFLDTYDTAITPPRQDLYRMDGSRIAVLNANPAPELAEYHFSPVEFLTVPADDGTTLYASMIKPPGFDPSRRVPVLIFTYGGPHDQVVRNHWSRDLLWHELMAQKGYLIFSLDNRGSYNRGHAFETPLYHEFGKIQLADQLAGVKFLKSLPYVDASRIGMWGWSYGGTMTLYALCGAPEVFKAGVAVAPVSDWRLYDTAYTERYMGRPQDNPEGYKNSSPANQAANLRGRLLLAQGTGDDNVHFANSSELINELILAGRYPEKLMIFPGRGHPIGDRPARIQLFEGITEFLLHNL